MASEPVFRLSPSKPLPFEVVNHLNKMIGQINTQFAAHQSAIDTANATISAQTKQISALQSEVANLKTLIPNAD